MKTNQSRTIYWSLLQYADWSMHIAASAEGLCYVGSANKPYEEMSEWIRKHHQSSVLERNDAIMEPYADELTAYMEGGLVRFSIPFDLAGTPFQRSVWDALCLIPYGETRSYSEIANHIGKPASVRAVGTAIGANPVLISVPCHRVIGKNGALTGYRGGMEMKTRLLALEKEAAGTHEVIQHG
ncbi:methylated-DNA--[protein]-cysteine S-methyltransferase [Paenibacillus dokdonensis]|uniref:Methylated-DNA--[protein]-cysteine S-methyltransferase n=1 Tax=Paenibacillus dokdonensis TaxID=2567944 RepID=A0ABU6GRW0_9BACL|nr:methylated-DNA--[protein]-cysteine S-methyltransferase [Paenibacillus dokdonensis]MEC0242477.1 methylated-DNA--[protein]-cysteine S-methyltransferase [Paenibacillus dokdonensis]